MPEPKSIDELIKSGLVRKGDDEYLNVRRLSTGIPKLDELLGGGVPQGRCIQTYGPESTGKTLIAQYVAKAVQKSDHPLCLYLDLERTFDEAWWKQSDVDTNKLLVTQPQTAEQAIDIMQSVLFDQSLGLIILDSIAGMQPHLEADTNRSAEEHANQPGARAAVVTRMYQRVVPMLENRVILWSTNQMRDNIGGYDELGALPGGRANRHYNSIILRTRREDWIKDTSTKKNLGFYMEIINKKNKTATVADGQSVTIPFMYNTQIDWTTSFIESGIEKGFITKKGPYFTYGSKQVLGMPNLRQFFTDNPDMMEDLRLKVDG